MFPSRQDFPGQHSPPTRSNSPTILINGSQKPETFQQCDLPTYLPTSPHASTKSTGIMASTKNHDHSCASSPESLDDSSNMETPPVKNNDGGCGHEDGPGAYITDNCSSRSPANKEAAAIKSASAPHATGCCGNDGQTTSTGCDGK